MNFGRLSVPGRLLLAGLAWLSLCGSAAAQITETTPSTKIGQAFMFSPSDAASYYSSLGSAATTSTNMLWGSGRPREIVELSRALHGDPAKIAEYIRNNVETVWMYGAQKGALGVIQDRSGTAFDQAMLMVELIRQAGGTANYQVGTISPTPAQFQAWTGLTSAAAACQMLGDGGIPASINGVSTGCNYGAHTITSITLAHIWVQGTTAAGAPFLFDPAFKPHSFKTGVNLATISGLTTGQPLAQAGTGMTSASASGVAYVSNLNAAQLNTSLQGYAQSIQTWIDNNVPAGEVEDVVGGAHIIPLAATDPILTSSLAYPATATATWTGGIPDAYRTTLTVQLNRTGGANGNGTFTVKLFVDEIYSRKLMLFSRGVGGGGGSADTLQLVDEFGGSTVVASTANSSDPPNLNDAILTLTANHPYMANQFGGTANGTYMDATVTKHVVMWLPLVIVHSWGDVDKRLLDKWGQHDDNDGPSLYQAGCDTCDLFAQSSGDGRREQLAAAWMVQSSKAAHLHAAIAKSIYVQHHSIGVVTADTEVQTVDNNPGNPGQQLSYGVRDSFDRLDIDSAFSLVSTTANAADRRAGVHAIAETLDTLEGSVAAQVADLPDTTSTATRFEWGNKPSIDTADEDPIGLQVSRKVYDFANAAAAQQASNLVKFETQSQASGASSHDDVTPTINASESGQWEGALADAITAYASNGFDVVASEESFLGPGQRAGAFVPNPQPNSYTHLPTHQRGGVMEATLYDVNGDPSQIAHIAVGLRDRAKGGGGGAQTGHQAQYDPSKAADVLKARFVDHSSALGVDLAHGSVTYTSPATLSVGQGEFPYKLDAQLIWRGGEVKNTTQSPIQHTSPQAPWTTNWNSALNVSSSGMEAMGDTDVRTSASAIAAFMALQDVYKATPSAQRAVTAGLVGAWWTHQLNHNAVTVNVGAGTQQFIRRTDGVWIVPGPGDFATLTENGAPTVYGNNCGKGGFVQTRGWDYSNTNFDVRRKNGDTQHFAYWTNRVTNGTSYCSDFHGFRLSTWTFPQGSPQVTITVNYALDSTFDLDVLSEVHNNLGRKITFINGGVAGPGLAGGFTNSLTGTDARSVSVSEDQTQHTDPNGKITTFAISTQGGGAPGSRYHLDAVYAADNATVASLAYGYDSLSRVMTAKDRLAVQGARQPYQFFIGEALRGERIDPLGQSYVVYYDLDTHPIRFIDEAGAVTTATYDGRGRVTGYTYPELDQELLAYDDHNNPTVMTRVAKPSAPAANLVVQASWDPTWNKPAYIIDARLHQTTFTYYASGAGAGLMATATRPAPTSGQSPPVYSFTYDAFGQLQTTTDPTNLVVRNDYDPTTHYLLTTTTDPTGIDAVTTFTTDAQGDPTSVNGPRSDVTDVSTTQYDHMRRKTLEAQPATADGPAVATQTQYDDVGRVQWVQEGSLTGTTFTWQRWTQYGYDADGNKTAEVMLGAGASGYQTETDYGYDALNRVQCTTVRMFTSVMGSGMNACALGAAGSFGADRITRTSYDPVGRVTQVDVGYNTPDQVTFARNTYSPNGQKATVQDANGNLTTYSYDGFDRLVKVAYPQATFSTPPASSTTDHELFTYDANGNKLTDTKRNGGVITYTYDALDRQISKTGDNISGVSTSYDSAGRIEQEDFASQGASISYTYDSARRLHQETLIGGPQPWTMTADYDVAGNRQRLTWPDGVYVDYTYDAANRLKEVRENGATSGAGRLASFTYGPLNQRAGVSRGNGTAATYSYDAIGRLNGLTQSALGTSPSSVQTMLYNPAGQVVHATQASSAYVWTGQPTTTSSYTHDGLNRDASIAAVAESESNPSGYDDNGNLTYDGVRSYEYDDESNLRSVDVNGSTVFATQYLNDGRLFAISNGQSEGDVFLYFGEIPVAEYGLGQDQTFSLQRRYVPGEGVDEQLVWYEGAGLTDKRWLHADRQGSIIAWSDVNGATGGTYTYGPYGEPQDWSGPRFRYTGQIALSEAQLYSYKARVYDPMMGRFLQTDPIGQKDDPNLYAYVKGDPANELDPTGLDGVDGNTCSKLGGTSCSGDYGGTGGGIQTQPGRNRPFRPSLAAHSAGPPPPGMGHNGGPPLEDVAAEASELESALLAAPLVALGVVGDLVLGVGPAGDESDSISGQQAGMLREAAQGRISGNLSFPGGPVSLQEANAIGRSFVGPNSRLISDAKGLASADGLRVFRFPTQKSYGGTVANLEVRSVPEGSYSANIHIKIKP